MLFRSFSTLLAWTLFFEISVLRRYRLIAIIEVSEDEKKAEANIKMKSKTLSQKVDSDSNQLPIIVIDILF
jgi:hypothetical protein